MLIINSNHLIFEQTYIYRLRRVQNSMSVK